MGYRYIPTRIAKTWNADNTKWWRGYRAAGTLVHGWWECKLEQPLEKTFTKLTKLSVLLTYNPGTMLLWYLPKEVENLCPSKNLDIWMFIAVLFIIAKTWKQIKMPCNCWIYKLWLIQKTEYFSGLQSNEQMWRKLKCIFLKGKIIVTLLI